MRRALLVAVVIVVVWVCWVSASLFPAYKEG
jgi:hypothetical protein